MKETKPLSLKGLQPFLEAKSRYACSTFERNAGKHFTGIILKLDYEIDDKENVTKLIIKFVWVVQVSVMLEIVQKGKMEEVTEYCFLNPKIKSEREGTIVCTYETLNSTELQRFMLSTTALHFGLINQIGEETLRFVKK